MCVANVEVGKVYKYGNSEVYVYHIKERVKGKGDSGRFSKKPEVIYAANLNKRYDRASLSLSRKNLGEEVQKPFNKEEWGIKVLFNILYNECALMYNFSKRSSSRRINNGSKLKSLYDDVYERCYNGTRSITSYKQLLARKNNLYRIVSKKQSNSRGAEQRRNRFNKAGIEKLPSNEECPKEGLAASEKRSAFERFINSNTLTNHMNLTYSEFSDMGLFKNSMEFYIDSPYDFFELNTSGKLRKLLMEWLGILKYSSYNIEKLEGREYFPNANVTDRENYIKPYGWPELYRGRTRTKEEVKAIKGKNNKKGLRYPVWLSLNSRYITSLCGHLVINQEVESMLNCKNCANIRYKTWLRGE